MQEKKCCKCKIYKALSEFHKNNKSKNGLSYQCKLCSSLEYQQNKETVKVRGALYYQNNKERIQIRDKNNKEKIRKWRKSYYQDNKQAYRDKKLKEYGITEQDFNLILIKQKNKCSICKSEFKITYDAKIDHCHKIGKVRGLLCNKCNLTLGNVNDSILILKQMIKYLQESLPLQHKMKL